MEDVALFLSVVPTFYEIFVTRTVLRGQKRQTSSHEEQNCEKIGYKKGLKNFKFSNFIILCASTPESFDVNVIFLYLLHLYPGFYSYPEGATWKIRDRFKETLLT